MTWVAAGVTAAAVVGGAAIQSDSARSAAQTQAGATNQAIALTNSQFNQTRADTAPARDAGTAALNSLKAALGLTPKTTSIADVAAQIRQNFPDIQGDRAKTDATSDADLVNGFIKYIPAAINNPNGAMGSQIDQMRSILSSAQAATAPGATPGATPAAPPGTPDLSSKFSVSDFWNDPVVQLGYQSGLDLGTKALRNAAPLTTGLDSGAALKELTQFGTDYTGRQAAASQARFVGDQTNEFNKLAALAGIGQTGVATSANAGATTAATNAGLVTGQGNAGAAAQIAGANAFTGGLNSVSNWWNQQQTLNRIFPQNTVPVGAGTSGYGYNGAAPNTNYYATD